MTYLFASNISISNEVEVKNNIGNPIPVTGNINVLQPLAVTDNNSSLTVDGTVAVNNFPVTQTITGTVDIGNIPEVEIKNDSGNPVTIRGNVTATISGSIGTVSFPATQTDAFGRLRISNPVTLFDSFHRYADNGSFATAVNGAGSAATFNANQGLVDLAIGTASGSYVRRETLRVFAYQPGKSLLIYTTFIFNTPKANLRQRVGYFGTNNGFYLEANGTAIRFVKRTGISGSAVDTVVEQASWNIDPMDGTGPSGITLDPSKAQILFIDMEWLGLGTVRMGFVIDGQFRHCHSFHHANILTTTYITTACLPLRLEIENTGATASASILKQVCSTVISEGGYELAGKMRTIGMQPITAANYNLATANVFYPVASIRLRSTYLDAIVIPKNIALVGTTQSDFRYKIISGATISGGTWVSDLADSAVEYNLSGTSFTGGTDLRSSYLISTGSQSLTVDLRDGDFKFQLQRDSFTATPLTFTLAVAAKSNNDKILAAIDWEEIT